MIRTEMGGSNVTAESIVLRQNRFSVKSAVALIFSDCIFVVPVVDHVQGMPL